MLDYLLMISYFEHILKLLLVSSLNFFFGTILSTGHCYNKYLLLIRRFLLVIPQNAIILDSVIPRNSTAYCVLLYVSPCTNDPR